MAAFDPQYPPTENSLNRLRLVLGSDHLLPDDLRGRSGYELLSSLALLGLIERYADPGAYPAEAGARMAWFYEQVAADAPLTHAVAETFGTALGGLVLTLLLNDGHTHTANPDKAPAYWAYWSRVRIIFLGGGMMTGTMGAQITQRAQAFVYQRAVDCHLATSAYPRYLPLLGAARTVPAGQHALVLDFGGTFVKRALAHYRAGDMVHLQLLESLPGHFPAVKVENPEDARPIFDRVADIIAQSYGDAEADTIPVSVAAYVDEQGQPLRTQHGIYMNLAQLTSDVPGALSGAVSERLGKAVTVRLLHDGTAAALFYAPLEQAAVIMLGTALGSGYPVARPNLALRPTAGSLTVD